MQKKVSFENLKDLDQKPTGLNEKEIIQQRLKFGPNDIVERAGNPWLELLLDTIKDPMLWFLVMIALIFFFIGDYQESLTLSLAILPLMFMDAFLHWRTQASTASMKTQLSSKVSVIRSGAHLVVDSIEIVPGDLVILSPENPFLPADGFWEGTESLQVDESVLTGEAFPVTKEAMAFDPFQTVGERILNSSFLGFAGTRVLTGRGQLRVLSTGQKTAYGEIVQSVTRMTHERTPLQISMLKLTRTLIYVSLLLCLFLAAIRYYQGHGWLDALLSAAVLAVAAVPEEFPVVFTFFLGVGVYRLAKEHALVRRAVSVENIGRVTQICTDKTGTLTLGQLKLTHIERAKAFEESEVLTMALAASHIEGVDPVDQVLVEEAHKRSLKIPQKLGVIPFAEDRKRETGFINYHNDTFICAMKGAPEVVLKKSNLSEVELAMWSKRVLEWAQGGHKVLAVASCEVSEAEVKSLTEPEKGFQLTGLLAFEDPARPEIKKALQYCRQNKIKVLMVTGDHPATAVAIAKDVGLVENSPRVISAETEAFQLEGPWLKLHPEFLKKIDIVARCNPLQKLRIVEALKTAGELVVVTGDGVNDVPALKRADIGVAMGLRGSRSAKEVSSIILTDDNFSTIVNAIREGKQLFSNLRMSFKYLLLFHLPFVLSAAIIPLMGHPLLYLPIHVVWLELIIHPTALFAFQEHAQEKDDHIYTRRSSLLSRKDIALILAVGVGITFTVIWAYLHELTKGLDVGAGRAKALALLTMWSAGVVLALTKGRTLSAKILMVATGFTSVVFIQNRWLAKIFHLTPLHLDDWLKVLASVLFFVLILFGANRSRKSNGEHPQIE